MSGTSLKRKNSSTELIEEIYHRLFSFYGPRNWWPGDSSFEVAVGAILTQNTSWSNVEKAIANLKRKGLLCPHTLFNMRDEELAELIRPAGYYNVKTRRLKAFLKFLAQNYDGDMSKMAEIPTDRLRSELLAVNGIGNETADSILLYALDRPVFVIDAYTKRIMSRHNILPDAATYEECQDFFHRNLRKDVSLFNEYHALIVSLGKDFCKPKPVCQGCPLG